MQRAVRPNPVAAILDAPPGRFSRTLQRSCTIPVFGCLAPRKTKSWHSPLHGEIGHLLTIKLGWQGWPAGFAAEPLVPEVAASAQMADRDLSRQSAAESPVANAD